MRLHSTYLTGRLCDAVEGLEDIWRVGKGSWHGDWGVLRVEGCVADAGERWQAFKLASEALWTRKQGLQQQHICLSIITTLDSPHFGVQQLSTVQHAH